MSARWWWLLFFILLAVLVVAFCIYEYRGVTDGRDGGTVSEWVHDEVSPWLVWPVLLGAALTLGWHFTVGKGKRWVPARKRDPQDPPA